MTAVTLDDVRNRLREWKEIEIAKTSNPVLGEGSETADIMFIGEAPGQKEDELGRPFVGQSGKLLDSLLAGIGLERKDVYISNIVKFRPPDNRDPTPEEKQACMPFLQVEIGLIKPKLLATLGRHALTSFFPDLSISEAHGKPQKLTDDLYLFPIYHPAAALHNPGLRSALEADFAALKDFLEKMKAGFAA